MRLFQLVAAALLLLLPAAAAAEDGYDLWLRYRPLEESSRAENQRAATAIVVQRSSPTLRVAAEELQRGLDGLLGKRPAIAAAVHPGAIVIGTPQSSPLVKSLRLPLSNLGNEGYLIRPVRIGRTPVTVIAANSDVGVLYGSFALLRHLQSGGALASLNITDRPRYALRMLNHWDNLDRTVERGYSGLSLWDWESLPGKIDPRYLDYARANASIGVNATALTNVNANAQVLTPGYLRKVAALAGLFRPYGIRVYLTARFSAPMEIGGLRTADPLEPAVRGWWKAKADEIYRLIPDFGGFLVKANSEGQPGPQEYQRTHADGANMLADALAPHGGTVFWRAFVYSTDNRIDRARQAYDEFRPLDGKFRRNVIVQVKNGPIDFQPREPFHPLFGAMPRTRMAMELQITKEYLGHGTHLTFLAPMWSEVFQARTYRPAKSSRMADTVSAVAGVSNVGSSRNWTGSHFDQANWYAFGRLAWNPSLTPQAIADEWARQTWGRDTPLLQPVTSMMLRSHQAAVDYMAPLGLTHLMGTSHHYGPAPWVSDLPQPSWNPAYYHRATREGIGFDRTPTGSNAVAQYAPEVARVFGDLRLVPDDFLLWFHRVPWTYRMRSGRTLWEELIHRYDRGLAEVTAMRGQWASAGRRVDARRRCEVANALEQQEKEARWWRDASIAYWQSINGLPLPPGTIPPQHPLDHYRNLKFEEVPGFLIPRIPPVPLCVDREAGGGGE